MKHLIRQYEWQQYQIVISYLPTIVSFSIYECKNESAKGYMILIVYQKLSCIKSQSKQLSKFQDGSLYLKYIQTQNQDVEIYRRAFCSKNIFQTIIKTVNNKFLKNILSKKLNLMSQFKYQCKETTPGRINRIRNFSALDVISLYNIKQIDNTAKQSHNDLQKQIDSKSCLCQKFQYKYQLQRSKNLSRKVNYLQDQNYLDVELYISKKDQKKNNCPRKKAITISFISIFLL
ncbi:hypothetical protein ABPG74_016921 [Tetrahymena malaccensis]